MGNTLKESFDELARLVGWTPERCRDTGESPMDVAADNNLALLKLQHQLNSVQQYALELKGELEEARMQVAALKTKIKPKIPRYSTCPSCYGSKTKMELQGQNCVTTPCPRCLGEGIIFTLE